MRRAALNCACRRIRSASRPQAPEAEAQAVAPEAESPGRWRTKDGLVDRTNMCVGPTLRTESSGRQVAPDYRPATPGLTSPLRIVAESRQARDTYASGRCLPRRGRLRTEQ